MDFQRRLMVVEDDSFLGSLVADALAKEGFATQWASSAIAAKRLIKTFDPDVVIVDIDLGAGSNGIEFVRMVRKARPDIAAILLSKHSDPDRAGLFGVTVPEGVAYLRKSLLHDTHALVDAINEAVSGISSDLRQDKSQKGWLDVLTKTQREILHMMSLGLSNSEIARQRGITLKSVEKRVGEIFKAFGIATDETISPRVEAVRRYLSEGGMPER